ncbi:type IV toxin-antitoxin system AbiEi family antitoxin [Microbacterium sp. cx-55]|uniref:type IV toxin-antitoxin system AbiEi family antitoxin n=1 Tax=Microbacterium sp. cx-55 TaxID=2875948 RepID=UPI001CBC1321|nr:type IV toxin-antitoxin system AbiEi family antitoxin [Microbacterium sp. cx-55]MBZ4486370.1 type IV toxin-antitoxin system AbiEi family antitoxin [Microbacterium sp. cx-55]UGB33791.1 type IV toxin-antitoxin system AbiEi family antitoxin [Microbacterium sp. cx-55]
MTSLFVYFPGERLSSAELSAACLDGHLVELGEGYVPADTVETSWLRAASLRAIAGTELAAILTSAAWVHGALAEPPARHRLQRASPQRIHEPIGRRFVYRDPQLPAGDIVRIAEVAVTTPARTVADLARSATPTDLAALQGFVDTDPQVLADGCELLRTSTRMPHKRAAIEILEDLIRTT